MVDAALKTPPRQQLRERLLALWTRTHDEALRRLANGAAPYAGGSVATERDRSDWISTSLMNAFKNTQDPEVFALLFELNREAFLRAIRSGLRRGRPGVDAFDVLQEAFLNMYRYPHRFVADRADAFRSWGHRVVRNTMLKLVQGQAKQPDSLAVDDEQEQVIDARMSPPESIAAEHESAELVNRAYLLFLALYLRHFRRLSPKTKRALQLVELDGKSYRDAAERIGIPLAHIKMVIFRGRRRILNGMGVSLEELEAATEACAAGEVKGPVPERVEVAAPIPGTRPCRASSAARRRTARAAAHR